MGGNPLKVLPWSYELYLESFKPNVDWKEWSKKVKKFQEEYKKANPLGDRYV